jgi:hypothetical protein
MTRPSTFLQDQVCGFMKNIIPPFYNRLWLEAQISTTGEPKSNGFNCNTPNDNFYVKNKKYPNPDFIFKTGEPDSEDHAKDSKYSKAWLIGDIKVSVGTLRTDVTENKNQWQSISNYATYKNRHQYSPLTFFIVWNNKGNLPGTEAELQEYAVQRGVFMYIIRING